MNYSYLFAQAAAVTTLKVWIATSQKEYKKYQKVHRRFFFLFIGKMDDSLHVAISRDCGN